MFLFLLEGGCTAIQQQLHPEVDPYEGFLSLHCGFDSPLVVVLFSGLNPLALDAAWYLGAMTAEQGPGTYRWTSCEDRYRTTVWEDGDAPNEALRSERIVTALNDLALRMSSAGGLPLFWGRPTNEHQAPRCGHHGLCRGAIPKPRMILRRLE